MTGAWCGFAEAALNGTLNSGTVYTLNQEAIAKHAAGIADCMFAEMRMRTFEPKADPEPLPKDLPPVV